MTFNANRPSTTMISMATLNIRGLNGDLINYIKSITPSNQLKHSDTKISSLINFELDKFDVFVLTETKLSKSMDKNQELNLLKLFPSYYTFHSRSDSSKAGVSLLIKKSTFDPPSFNEIVPGNIIKASTICKKTGNKVNIIGYYNNNVSKNKDLYNKMQEHLSLHNLIILGDFNESLYPQNKSNYPTVVQVHDDTFRQQFKVRFDLHELTNNKTEFTYKHSNGTESVIDWIFVSSNLFRKCNSVFVRPSEVQGLDHKLICAKLIFRSSFISSTPKSEFQIPNGLFEKHPSLRRKAKKIIRSICDDVNIPTSKKHLLISSKIHKLCRNKVLTTIQNAKVRNKNLSKKVSDPLSSDLERKQCRDKLHDIYITKMRDHAKTNDFNKNTTYSATKSFTKLLNSKLNKPSSNDYILDSNNTKLTGNVAADYIGNSLESIYIEKPIDNSHYNYFVDNIIPFPPNVVSELDKPFTVEESINALKRLPLKAPGPLCISADFYKTFAVLISPLITQLANDARETGSVPPELLHANITVIPKQDKDPHLVDNLRPIFILEPLRKCIELMMQNRLSKSLISSNIIGEHQNCHPQRNIEDNILTHLFLTQYTKETGTPAYCLLTDFRKAFDLVQHEYIKKLLQSYHLTNKTINFFMSFLKGIGRVKYGKSISRNFNIHSGTPQGSVLSPALFILSIEPLLRTLNRYINGFSINSFELKLKAYADDLMLYFLHETDIKAAVEVIIKFGLISGSILNFGKCSILWLGVEPSNKDPINDIKFSSSPERILGVYFNSLGPINNLDEKIEVMTKTAIVMKKLYPSFNLSVTLWKTYCLSKILFLAGYLVATKEQNEKIDNLCDWFLFYKQGSFVPQKTIKDIARLHNSKENGGKDLFTFLHYQCGNKTKILKRCLDPSFKDKHYIILLTFILDIRYNNQKNRKLFHPLLDHQTLNKETFCWVKQGMIWFQILDKVAIHHPTSEEKVTYKYREHKGIQRIDSRYIPNNFTVPCIEKIGPTKSNLDNWKNVTITICNPALNKTRDIIRLFVKESELTSSQLLFIEQGFSLEKFFYYIKSIRPVNELRTNCALNKYGRMFHFKDNKNCKNCNEPNNSMHVVFCNYLNELELEIRRNPFLISNRIQSSINHNSPDHTHSWIINRARWDVNNRILYGLGNQETTPNRVELINLFKMKIRIYEHDHLEYTRKSLKQVTHSQLSKYCFFTISKNNVVHFRDNTMYNYF
eukprot:TRINITY_DN1233_c0_g1_i7.p1 TRINITY_DN1233_c0_g1~~TRINITY_DN1233_c0_g1_i7.p1  ORF type:complete len:1224 (-),score=213.05 TRINITY_DN1233_c0_g1_i7:434-4105(-)